MDDEALLRALERDDAYHVVRVLADKPSGRTELVRGAGPELLVRKRIPLELANEQAWRMLARLKHPLLPRVRDLYQLPDQLVVVTDYVEGSTLAELVAVHGSLKPLAASCYICDLCDALGELHANGLVHRDVAPTNVVVSEGRAHLIDLGNARAYVKGAGRDTTKLGTWGFAAPEQYGFAQTDARSDIYALGGLLGYLLTGVLPGQDGFDAAVADRGRVPGSLRNVIERARSFEPSVRYQSTAAFERAICLAMPDADDALKVDSPWRVVGRQVAVTTSVPLEDAWAKNGMRTRAERRSYLANSFRWMAIIEVGCLTAEVIFTYLGTCFATENMVRPMDRYYNPASGIIFTVYLCVAFWEFQACMRHEGRYANNPHPWLQLGCRLVVHFGAVVVALVIAVPICEYLAL